MGKEQPFERGITCSAGSIDHEATTSISGGSSQETAYLPTWVNRYRVNGRWVYEVIPVFQALQNKEAYNLTNTDSIERAKISLNNTVNWIKEHNTDIKQIID